MIKYKILRSAQNDKRESQRACRARRIMAATGHPLSWRGGGNLVVRRAHPTVTVAAAVIP